MNPYKKLPSSSFWRRSISTKMKFEIDPVISTKFKISKDDRICTAGSCFAQNLAKALKANGYNYHVTEKPKKGMSKEEILKKNYEIFSARYGNIYTTVQLYEILRESIGDIETSHLVWKKKDQNLFIDSLRPNIGDSFENADDVIDSRIQHLKYVKKIIEESNIFVFTLGLTESWMSKKTSRILPVAPGVYNEDDSIKEYKFKNLNYIETFNALSDSIKLMKRLNPKIKIILTVSPVPLIATYEQRHVLVSNTYSKSLLRVVASDVAEKNDFVDYFPSYEIITGSYTYSSYFKNDLREVEEIGIKHVMEVFLKHYSSESKKDFSSELTSKNIKNYESDSEIICDEEEIDRL